MVNFVINRRLERRIKHILETGVFQSGAELSRFALLNYLEGIGRNNDGLYFNTLSEKLGELADEKIDIASLPPLEEQLESI